MVPAFESGADALITADVRHHNLLLAKELDFCLIDAGHFETENIIVPILAERLRTFSGLETVLIPQGCLLYTSTAPMYSRPGVSRFPVRPAS